MKEVKVSSIYSKGETKNNKREALDAIFYNQIFAK